jgi:hypothetical protein
VVVFRSSLPVSWRQLCICSSVVRYADLPKFVLDPPMSLWMQGTPAAVTRIPSRSDKFVHHHFPPQRIRLAASFGFRCGHKDKKPRPRGFSRQL